MNERSITRWFKSKWHDAFRVLRRKPQRRVASLFRRLTKGFT
jgi:hypothetical protein